jgi:hypothetical protein
VERASLARPWFATLRIGQTHRYAALLSVKRNRLQHRALTEDRFASRCCPAHHGLASEARSTGGVLPLAGSRSIPTERSLFDHNLFFGADLYLRFTTIKLNRTYDLHLLSLQICQTRIRRLRRILRDPNHKTYIRIIATKI